MPSTRTSLLTLPSGQTPFSRTLEPWICTGADSPISHLTSPSSTRSVPLKTQHPRALRRIISAHPLPATCRPRSCLHRPNHSAAYRLPSHLPMFFLEPGTHLQLHRFLWRRVFLPQLSVITYHTRQRSACHLTTKCLPHHTPRLRRGHCRSSFHPQPLRAGSRLRPPLFRHTISAP